MLNAMLPKQWIYAAALLLTVIAGCTGRHETGQGKLDGDVFIVTQGAENLKLGLVEVKVLPYEETKKCIAQTRAQAEGKLAELKPKLEAARKALASTQARERAGDAETHAALQQMANVGVDEDRFTAASNDFDAAHHRWGVAREAVRAAISAVSELEEQARSWNSGALYFASLPSPVTSVKTDADGKFSIPLDRKATVVLAAYATRRVVDKIENYYWLVTVSLDGQASKRIFLSNDNLATSESKDSLIQVVE